MNWILFVIALCSGLIAYAVNLYFIITFVKKPPLGDKKPKIDKKLRIILLSLNLGIGLLTILSSYGLTFLLKEGEVLDAGEMVMLIFGSYLFGTATTLLTSSFTLFYYCPNLDVKQRKVSRIVIFASIPFIVIGLWLLTDAFAPHIIYPLFNGISFTRGLIRPNTTGDLGFNIKFYGILIVFGAGVAYVISDHYFYKEFGKHGIIDTLLVVAFPAGIIGARVWYCTVLEPGTNLFAIREGGLAIQGGALGGIVVGVAFMLIFRRYVNVRWAMDVIVPTILLAQMIGRWGNFFNVEVHGLASDMSNWWFLPKIIANNMQYSSTASSLVGTDPAQMYVPLFLIEGISNIIGYFLIRYGVGRGLKRWTAHGDQAMLYVIWYGLTRYLLEPLRSSSYEYNNSWVTAIVMIAIGVFGIIAFHVIDIFYLKYKSNPTYFIRKEFPKDKKELLASYKSILKTVDDNEDIALYLLLKDKYEKPLEIFAKYINDYSSIRKKYYLQRIDTKCLFAKCESKSFYKNALKNNLNPIVEQTDNGNTLNFNNYLKQLVDQYNVDEILPILVESLSKRYSNVKHGEVNLLTKFDDDVLTISFARK